MYVFPQRQSANPPDEKKRKFDSLGYVDGTIYSGTVLRKNHPIKRNPLYGSGMA
jgi:hypothetical protein